MLGVTRTNNEGSRRLIHAAAKAGGAAMHERGLTEEEADEHRQRAKRLNLAQYLRRHVGPHNWSADQIRLLGTLPDDELAKKIGKTHNAVRIKREKLGIPNPVDHRRSEYRKGMEHDKRRTDRRPDVRGRRLP